MVTVPKEHVIHSMPLLSSLCEGRLGEMLDAYESRTVQHFQSDRPGRFQDLFSLDAANQILGKSLVPQAFLKVMKNRETLPNSSFLVSVPVGYGYSDVIDPGKLQVAFSTGATLVLQGIQTFWSPAKSFARQLESEISHEVQINVYITPPRCPGAGIHYDSHDVLLLQVEGSKDWEIGPIGFIDPTSRHSHTKDILQNPIGEKRSLTVHAGDVLYVPRGVLHQAHTSNQISIHLTIGVMIRTYADILQDMTDEAFKCEMLRKAFPLGYLRSEDESVKAFQDGLAVLRQWIETVNLDALMSQEHRRLNTVRRTSEVQTVMQRPII